MVYLDLLAILVRVCNFFSPRNGCFQPENGLFCPAKGGVSPSDMAYIALRKGPFRLAIWAILQNQALFLAKNRGKSGLRFSISPLFEVLISGRAGARIRTRKMNIRKLPNVPMPAGRVSHATPRCDAGGFPARTWISVKLLQKQRICLSGIALNRCIFAK